MAKSFKELRDRLAADDPEFEERVALEKARLDAELQGKDDTPS